LKNFRDYGPYDSATPTNSGIDSLIVDGPTIYILEYCTYFIRSSSNSLYLAVEFDHSGSYLAVGGSDVR